MICQPLRVLASHLVHLPALWVEEGKSGAEAHTLSTNTTGIKTIS